jgi:bifunctional non-homologous end joining protein LigD
MEKTHLKIGLHAIEITHPEKLLFPDEGITKGEFVDYHRRVAEVMVPHLKGRPIIMYRFHGSIETKGFYQQQIPSYAPGWISRVTVKKEGGTVTHMVCDEAATQAYMAEQDCITPHVWLSRADHIENPDQMIFDLDPPGDDFEPVRQGARFLKSILDDLGLDSYLKTTGSHGLHVVVPLAPTEPFNTVRALAQEIAGVVTGKEPDKYTTEQRKEKRKSRLFIDTLRNAYAHTAVAPYAVRARNKAPIAAPLFWEELTEKKLTSERYNIRNIFKRLDKIGDPWKEIDRHPQSLDPARQKLREMKLTKSLPEGPPA